MKTSFNERYLLFTLSISVLLASLGTSLANVALPAISLEFTRSFTEVRWVVLIYLFTITFLSVSVGRWADLLGRKRMLLIGILLFSVGSLFCGLADSLLFLLLARAVQAFGGAALIVLPLALIQDKTPSEKLGRNIGFIATLSAIGTASGPSVGGLVINALNWHFIFYGLALIGAFNFYLIFNCLSESSSDFRSSPISLKMMMFELAHTPVLLVQLLSNLIVSTLMMSTLVLGPFFLKEQLKISYLEVGAIMSVGPILSILTGPPSGFLVDRLGRYKCLMVALIQLFVGSLAFAFLPSHLGVAGYVFSSVLLSPGYQLFQAANSASIMNRAKLHQRATFSGLLNLSRGLGLIAGALFMGEIFSVFSSTSKVQGFQITFMTTGFLILIAFVLNLTQQRKETT